MWVLGLEYAHMASTSVPSYWETQAMIFFLRGTNLCIQAVPMNVPLPGIQLITLVQLQLPRRRITVKSVAWSPCPFLRLELLGILEISLH